MNKLFYYTWVFTLSVSLFNLPSSNSVKAQESQTVESEPEVKLFPDWNEISLSSLGTFTEDGQIGTEYNNAASYDVSRSWTTENTPDEVLMLGDLETSLAPQEFTVEEIVNINNSHIEIDPMATANRSDSQTNPDLENFLAQTPLSDFSVVSKQTIETLVEAVPDLELENASDVQPIADLLVQEGFDNLDTDLATLITDEEVANLSLESIDDEQYAIDSIPGIESAKLGDFEDYQSSFVSEIPGLSDVPLTDYPQSIEGVGNFVGRIDFVWGSAETDRQRTISGSYVEGFNVPCQSNCQYLELDDLENAGSAIQSAIEGKQWIAGKDHWVAGGTGCLSGGREPTGIHPFGNSFKTVLWDTDETTDTATIMMFFNFKTQCGESAYFIGPIPFPLGFVKVNDWVYLGTGV